MERKIFCPYCERCLGECCFNDESGVLRVTKIKPEMQGKKHLLHNMKCVRCKNLIYILMEFED